MLIGTLCRWPILMGEFDTLEMFSTLICSHLRYEYTREFNRNWRKTRSPVSLVCWGVDPNRNFAFNWLIKDEFGNEGASRAPCSDLYAGSKPFIENETIALNNYMIEHHDKFDVYLSYHSYAHMMLFPMGHTRVPVVRFKDFLTLTS
jgi:Zinc carboxypeptidase